MATRRASNHSGDKVVQCKEACYPSPTTATKSKKVVDIENAIDLINQGCNVLVILRGMPGSGKSYLAQKILQSTIGFDSNHHYHILSSNDFFYRNGWYMFDVRQIGAAHHWNVERAFHALRRGFTPVIIDNNNTEMWEMKPYAAMATDYEYIIQIIEPDTHWGFNAEELFRRNTHNVTKLTIRKMIDRFERNVTPEMLLRALGPVYKLKPLQRRLYFTPDTNAKLLVTNKHNNVSKITTLSEVKSKEIETKDLIEDKQNSGKAGSESNVLQTTKMDMIIVSSDKEDKDTSDMRCEVGTAAQPTVPNMNSDSSSSSKGDEPKKKRSKKDQRKSMESNLLKSLIESRIVIGEEHYSKRIMKVKSFKFGSQSKYQETVDTLMTSTGTENVIDRLKTIREPPIQNEVLQEMKEAQRDNCYEEYDQLQEATFYRAEASKYLNRYAKILEKSREYHKRGMGEVAHFYSDLAELQKEYANKANGMAASTFLETHSKRLGDSRMLDLHYLFVGEAVLALDAFLDRNINQARETKLNCFTHLLIITGRGKRSRDGISKIRPVVQARLEARNLRYEVLNPGRLEVQISEESMVTSEMPRSL